MLYAWPNCETQPLNDGSDRRIFIKYTLALGGEPKPNRENAVEFERGRVDAPAACAIYMNTLTLDY